MGTIVAVILFSLFGLCHLVSSSVNLYKIFSCKKQINAYCVGKERRLTGFRSGRNPILTFSYRFEGKDYYRETKHGITIKFYNSVRLGEQCNIYINENKPQMYVTQRKATSEEIFNIIMGVFFLASAIFMYLFLVI